MDKLNKHLTESITSINRCVIHYGTYIFNQDKDLVFDKKISKSYFDMLLSKFVTNDYSVNKKKIYNIKNVFYDVEKKYAFKKINCSNFEVDYKNLLVELFNEVDIGYANFTCKREYHNIYDYELTRIKIAPELYLNFVQEGNFYTFSIEIIVDHNIDNTIIKLNKILELL